MESTLENLEKNFEIVEIVNKLTTGQRFTDINGKTKEIRIFKDSRGQTRKGHSGNSNYILTAVGVIHHNVRKVVNRTKHLCKMYKMM